MSEVPDSFDLNRFFSAVARWEPALDAWAYRVASAELPQAGDATGPLAGVPFGVKDVIDVRGQPTRFGSNAFAEAGPAAADAPVVRALRTRGAVPVGKTRSTEFAFIDPTTTRNPFDLKRSPGGSSSGSGAVVGAHVVPFALGTQTAGSLCRPATYCGAFSYKPGLGVLPQTGMAPLSHSFDAIGVIAASPYWLGKVFAVLAEDFAIPLGPKADRSLNIGLLAVPEQSPEPAMQQVMANVSGLLGEQGHSVTRVESPISFPAMIDRHRTVMLHEMARNLSHIVRGKEGLLQPRFRDALADGASVGRDARDGAMDLIENEQGEIGYWLAKPYWGQGITPEAVRCFCEFAFERFQLQRIYGKVFATNPRSSRVLSKVGFKHEGTLRNGYFRDGQPVDDHLFGLLRDEFVNEAG